MRICGKCVWDGLLLAVVLLNLVACFEPFSLLKSEVIEEFRETEKWQVKSGEVVIVRRLKILFIYLIFGAMGFTISYMVLRNIVCPNHTK